MYETFLGIVDLVNHVLGAIIIIGLLVIFFLALIILVTRKSFKENNNLATLLHYAWFDIFVASCVLTLTWFFCPIFIYLFLFLTQ